MTIDNGSSPDPETKAPTMSAPLNVGASVFTGCQWCRSRNHTTQAHSLLEQMQTDGRQWLNGLRVTTSPGRAGAPSHSVKDLVKPDLLRLVPFTIGSSGWEANSLGGAATLRLWKRGPSEEVTFMLSFVSLTPEEEASLFQLFGDRGSIASVAMRFEPLPWAAALPSIAAST